jgi:large subunit ribosomal protein L5
MAKKDKKTEAAQEAAPKAEAAEGQDLGNSTMWEKYRNEIAPALTKQFGYKNAMQVPRLQKVVINTCLKEAISDFKLLESIAGDLATITGQRPVYTQAKKSISNFKLREGMKIGAQVTLRGKRMYEFVNRLMNVALPRVRDFKGVSPKAFDGRGNYTLGVTEQSIFPEINLDKVAKVTGMNITFVCSAKTDAEGKALLQLFGMPFRT